MADTTPNPTASKTLLAQQIVELGIQAARANKAALADMTGLTELQIKKQLEPNRNNLRKAFTELAKQQ